MLDVSALDVAMTKPYLLPHPHMVNDAHPATWRTHTKFQPDSLVLRLALAAEMTYGCGYDKPHPHVATS